MANEERTKGVKRDSSNGKEKRGKRKGREQAYRRIERTLDEGMVQGMGRMVTPFGDEANMHALDPAKVHLDHIALHYGITTVFHLIQCDRPEGGTGERGRNGTSGDLERSPRHHLASYSSVQGSSDLYVPPMWPTSSNVVLFLERQRGNACLIIYTTQVAWNFTVSYVILAHAFSRAWTCRHT